MYVCMYVYMYAVHNCDRFQGFVRFANLANFAGGGGGGVGPWRVQATLYWVCLMEQHFV